MDETLETFLSSKTEYQPYFTGDFNVETLDYAHMQSGNLQYLNLRSYVDAPRRYAKTSTDICVDLVTTEEDISDVQSVITSCTPKLTLAQTDNALFRRNISVSVDKPSGTDRY